MSFIKKIFGSIVNSDNNNGKLDILSIPNKYLLLIDAGASDIWWNGDKFNIISTINDLLLKQYLDIPKDIRSKKEFPFVVVDKWSVSPRRVYHWKSSDGINSKKSSDYQIDITYSFQSGCIKMKKYKWWNNTVPDVKIIEVKNIEMSDINSHVKELLQEIIAFISEDDKFKTAINNYKDEINAILLPEKQNLIGNWINQ